MRRRLGHLGTANSNGLPHVVPVCFALADNAIYTPIDEKPKGGNVLKRLKNISDNPQAAFLADRYDEDWSLLGWVLADGRADIVDGGSEQDAAQALLRARYRQYASMRLSPVIAIRIRRVRSWGNLDG